MRVNFITNNIKYIKPNTRPKQSFKGFDCDESSFEIKRTYNLPCPVCNVMMVQKNQLDAFVSKAKTAKGEELLSLMEKYDRYFQPIQKQVAEIIKIEASKYPDKNMLELAHIYTSSAEGTIKYQQLEEIENIRKTLNSITGEKAIGYILNKYKDIIESGRFSQQDFLREIRSVIPSSTISDKKLERILKNIPENNSPEYRYMVKYSAETIARFASSLLEPSLATCEHIVPKSLGGKNNTENYLAECNNDNSNKGDTPFSIWAAKKPNFKENLQKYLDVISEKIQTGEIPIEYIEYPLDIAKTIARETNGNISVEATRIEKREAPQEDTAQENTSQVSFNQSEYANKKKELEELIALRDKLASDEEYIDICEYTRLKQEKERCAALKKNLLDKISKLKDFSDRYYKSLFEIEEISEKLAQPNLSRTEEKSLRNKRDRLEKFLASKNISEIDAELKAAIIELQDNIPLTDDVAQKLDTVKGKISFPDEIESEIERVKAEIFKSNQINGQISKIRKNIKERVKLQSQVTQMESAVEGLARENKMLNISSTPQDGMERYRNVNYILERCDTLEELCKKTLGDKFLQFDSLIFDFSKEQAEKELEIMYKDNDYAHYQRNLTKIENLTKEIKSLQTKIASYLSEEAKLGELNNELNSLRLQGDIIQEFEDLKTRLVSLKEKFDNVNIDAKIEECKKELEELEIKINKEEAEKTQG